MSDDRRPSNLYVHELGDQHEGRPRYNVASTDQIIAVVRRGVESGTIKGKMEQTVDCSHEHPGHSSMEVFDLDPGTYLVIGPVSDGGEDRP